MNPLLRAVLGSLAAMAAAAVAVRLVDAAFDAWEGRAGGAERARRRVELQDLAERLEAELEGVHLVREVARDLSEPLPMARGGIAVHGPFGSVPTGEA